MGWYSRGTALCKRCWLRFVLECSWGGLILVWPNDLTDQSATIGLHAPSCELDDYSTDSHFPPYEKRVLSCPTDVGRGQWPAWLVECGWTFSVPASSVGLERHNLFPLALLGVSGVSVRRTCLNCCHSILGLRSTWTDPRQSCHKKHADLWGRNQYLFLDTTEILLLLFVMQQKLTDIPWNHIDLSWAKCVVMCDG